MHANALNDLISSDREKQKVGAGSTFPTLCGEENHFGLRTPERRDWKLFAGPGKPWQSRGKNEMEK